MAEEATLVVESTASNPRKRKNKHKGQSKVNRHAKPTHNYQGVAPKKGRDRESKKTKRLLRKRVREYNSDDESDEQEKNDGSGKGGVFEAEASHDSDVSDEEEGGIGDVSDEGMDHGVTKFAEGSRAFNLAFSKIMKSKSAEEDSLGPILSAHKKLVAEKLAEEMEDQKAKGEMKKEKCLVTEKGHVQPLKYLDSKEKFLISIATKGVVKLFNAVNKAKSRQNLVPSKSKDAKDLAIAHLDRKRDGFIKELQDLV